MNTDTNLAHDPIVMSEADYQTLSQMTIEKHHGERASQERSRQVKKNRHGEVRVLLPLGDKRRQRGGKKSRRTHNSHVWVDPKLLEDEMRNRSRKTAKSR